MDEERYNYDEGLKAIERVSIEAIDNVCNEARDSFKKLINLQ